MRSVAFGLAVGMVFSGCADLASVKLGYCGNQVVEPGEDCDTYPTGQCRPPGVPGQCRYDCSSGTDLCPSGWGCGSDGICRVGTGRFQDESRPIAEPVHGLLLADFDANGSDDLVAVGSSGVTVHFHDSSGATRQTMRPGPELEVPPVAGDLNGDGRWDLVLLDPTEHMLTVAHGSETLGLAAIGQATALAEPPSQSVRYLLLNAYSNPGSAAEYPGDELLKISGRTVTSMTDGVPLFDLPQDLASSVGIIQQAVDRNLPCDQFLGAFATPTADDPGFVEVFTPCTISSSGQVVRNQQPHLQTYPRVRLPNAPVSLAVGRVDSDDFPDIIVRTGWEIAIAHGVGDGTFHSTWPVPETQGDGAASSLIVGSPGSVLALDLISDDLFGLVTNEGIRPFRWNQGEVVQSEPTLVLHDWRSAVVGDLNGNGEVDVLGVPKERSQLDFCNGRGDGKFNLIEIPLRSPVESFGIGDFDGDLLADIAIGQPALLGSGKERQDELSLLFGEAFHRPADPVAVARFSGISDILVGELVTQGAQPDGFEDLMVLSSAGTSGSSTVFLGGSERQLDSPFLLDFVGTDGKDHVHVPYHAVVGEFDGDTLRSELALLALDDATGTSWLWHIPTSDDGSLDRLGASRQELQATGSLLEGSPQFTTATGIAVDLDEDGRDELVAFGPDGVTGRVAVFRYQDGDFRLSSLAPTAASYTLPRKTETAEWSGTKLGKGDIDADGHMDVIAIGLYATEHSRVPGITLLLGDGEGSLVEVGPVAEGVLDAALINVDEDESLEVVTIDPSRVRLMDFEQGSTYPLRESAILAEVGGDSIVSGDVNGDGVQDLAVATVDGVLIFQGVPRLR